ncbi:MAG: hypothetical protein ABI361_03000 [Nitrososphaera sp.]|jgi:hypothetical protein
MGVITLQLVCDDCKMVVLEKTGEQHLLEEKFPITKEEEAKLAKNHLGHNCHIEAVEKG